MRDKDRSCTSKKEYNTWQDAQHDLRAVRRKDVEINGFAKPYRCPFCPYWHIGHTLNKNK